MEFLSVLELVAALAGLAVVCLVTLYPRFGAASWALILFLIPGSMAAATLGLSELLGLAPEQPTLVAFSLLLFSGTGLFLASYVLERDDYYREFRKHQWFFMIVAFLGPVFAGSLYLFRNLYLDVPDPLDSIRLGYAGYGAALYLLLVSVIALANVEQTLRGAEEHVRWEIKFLLLGLASLLGSLVYVASTVLLYAPADSILAMQTLRIFPLIFLCSSILIFQSWRRATGRSHVIVSQGVVYSTITLFTVGAYLIGSSLIARWAGGLFQPGIPVGPVVFLVLALILALLLLGTTLRHRVRRWIRRNVFVGRYDYRRFWMDATEHVRSTDPSSVSAAALAELVESALGSPDITVWLRVQNSDVLLLATARGSIADAIPSEAQGLIGPLESIVDPISVSSLQEQIKEKPLYEFLSRTKASLLAPLVSSGRLVGLLTVGADRSGKEFDQETLEFIRVLALHSASEFHKSELLASLVATREAEAFRTFSTFLLHDLKNFASTLSLIAKNATRHHANPDFQVDAFHSILDTAEKMKKLCNSLRTFSTSLAVNKRPHDLDQVVRSVVDTFNTDTGVHLEVELSQIPALTIDKDEIARVLHNLVLNACEASSGSPIRVRTALQDGSAVITVEDYGKGIPKQFMERGLFQPFHTTKNDGLGIGLFQSRKIIEAHNGTIEVSSTEGRGTTVRVVLPLTQESPSLTTPPLQHRAPEPVFAKARIAN